MLMRKYSLSLIFKLCAAFLAGPFLFFEPARSNESERSLRLSLSKLISLSLYYIVQFHWPLHWATGIMLHLGLCVYFTLKRPSFFFNLYNSPQSSSPPSVLNAFSSVSLCLYPVIFIAYLSIKISVINLTSVQMPVDLFSSGFLMLAIWSPAVGLLTWLLYKSKIVLQPVHILLFYASVLLIILIFSALKSGHEGLLSYYRISHQLPLFFKHNAETKYREILEYIFLSGGIIIISPLLISAGTVKALMSRFFMSFLLCVCLFINYSFLSGSINYYHSLLASLAYNNQLPAIYQIYTRLQPLRVPGAVNMPQKLATLSELLYQKGQTNDAITLWQKIIADYGHSKPDGRLIEDIGRILSNLQKTKSNSNKIDVKHYSNNPMERKHELHSSDNDTASILLPVPIVSKSDFHNLDFEWYGILSAISYLYPDLSSLELKEKVLDIYSIEEQDLPAVSNVPDLAAILERLSIPYCMKFITSRDIAAALRGKSIPMVFYQTSWVPITGYDADRDGYYYLDYSSYFYKKGSLFNTGFNEDIIKPPQGVKPLAATWQQSFPYKKFISRKDLDQYILDIGGVGLFLGDSAIAGPRESASAYYIELGDMYYQIFNNYTKAASCYQRAHALYPGWVPYERMFYLKIRFQRLRSDLNIESQLFYNWDNIPWLRVFPIEESITDTLSRRIYTGLAGRIILEQCAPLKSYKDSARLDTLLQIYTFLHESDKFNISYLDSLAKFELEAGHFDRSKKLHQNLVQLLPYDDADIYLRLGWTLAQLGEANKLKNILKKTSPASDRFSKFYTLEGAYLLSRQKYDKAGEKLLESLKMDKTLGLTHKLLAQYYAHQGQSKKEALHLKWYKRCSLSGAKL